MATSVEQVKDIYTGLPFYSSLPDYLTVVNGELFFAATDADTNFELWKTDGTTLGTVQVRDIDPGTDHGSAPEDLTKVGSILFFTADLSGSDSGRELWKSNGTQSGTVKVADIASVGGSHPAHLTDVNGTAFFTADDGAIGRELYSSDGNGANLIANINTAMLTGSDPQELTEVDGKLFLSADDGSNGAELWVYDPSIPSLDLRDINSGSGQSLPRSLTDIGGILFFRATDGLTGIELWKSDGTLSGTTQIKDINPDGASSSPHSIIDVNGTAFFTADDGTNGTELWKSDGTEEGTVMVADINPDAGDAFTPLTDTEIHAIGSTLFFPADDGTNGVELWKTDGTQGGTVMVKDINNGGDADPGPFASAGGMLYFVADDGVNGRELWESDGTPAGTMMVANIAPGSLDAFPADKGDIQLVSFDDSVFFSALDGDLFTTGDGFELWRTVNDTMDTDEDGIPDDYEDANGLDKNDPDDAGEDLDMDGVTNLGEYENDLDPRDPDADGDGIGDAFDNDLVSSNFCDEDVDGNATFTTNVPANTTIQCAASNSVTVDAGATIDETGGRLEVISPAVSLNDGFSVPTGAELSLISADPVPGMLVAP